MSGISLTIALGSVVSCEVHAKRTDQYAFHPPKGTQASFKLDHLSTNGWAKQFPYDASLSRSCRLLAAKPPNGTRTRFNTRTSQ